MTKSIGAHIDSKLLQRREAGMFRRLIHVDGMVDFCSNDYLGYARNSECLENSELSGGSTGSRLLSGNSKYAEELEAFIANYHGAQSGLIYNSGYDANLGFFSCVPYRGDTIIYDELSHASIRDGIRLNPAASFSFAHNDLNDLEDKLKRSNGNTYVAVESVYSMDGDFSPLEEIQTLCEKYGAGLVVDEAHATGVFGNGGKGRVVELGLEGRVFVRMHTFGKALGTHGAVVLGSANLRDFLINFSRPFIYSTALPEITLCSIKKAYDKMSKDKDKTLKLRSLISLFKDKIKDTEYGQVLPSNSAIQGIIVGGNEATVALAKKVQNDGFDVRPILSPTVPNGSERLRISLHAFNTNEEIIGLVESLKKQK
jgi:8-amino-7-oxononanoate synthase